MREQNRAWAEVVGTAYTPILGTPTGSIDELVFDATRAALRRAGLRRADIDLSVTASLDVYDGRSISAGYTNSASGGYGKDAIRLEGDGALAVHDAAAAILAGDAEVAIAVAVFSPEIGPATPTSVAPLDHLAMDAVFERPLGLTGVASLGMHASAVAERDPDAVRRAAALAAAMTQRGARRGGAARPAVSTEDVLAAPRVADPLTELMLPALCGGVAAIVLANPPRAARISTTGVGIVGFGAGSNPAPSSARWVDEPARGAVRARRTAEALVGDHPAASNAARYDVYEYTALTAFLDAPIAAALGSPLAADPGVLASGGSMSAFPGIVNGVSRVIHTVKQLLDHPRGRRGISHSVDAMTGLPLQQHTVTILEVVR